MKKKVTSSKLMIAATRAMDLPESPLLNLPHVEIEGGQVLIEHHMGIIEYSPTLVKIGAKGMTISVVGDEMCMIAMSVESLRLKGIIESVQLIREGE